MDLNPWKKIAKSPFLKNNVTARGKFVRVTEHLSQTLFSSILGPILSLLTHLHEISLKICHGGGISVFDLSNFHQLWVLKKQRFFSRRYGANHVCAANAPQRILKPINEKFGKSSKDLELQLISSNFPSHTQRILWSNIQSLLTRKSFIWKFQSLQTWEMFCL